MIQRFSYVYSYLGGMGLRVPVLCPVGKNVFKVTFRVIELMLMLDSEE